METFMSSIRLSMVTIIAYVAIVCSATAADNVPSVVGTWSLTGLSYRILETGEVVRPFGDNVHSLIQYSPGGHMVVFIQKKNPPMPSDTDYSDESRVRIHKEIIGAYAGTYSVDGNRVTHHIIVGWRPDWVGHDQVRYADMQGNVLTIETAPLVSLLTGKQSVATLTFLRVE